MIQDVKVFGFGIAEQLQKHVNCEVDGHPLWASRFLYSDPDAVYNTYMDFLRAGSQIISTITYQASVEGFMENFNVSRQEAIGLMKKAVELAQKAVNDYKQEVKGRDVPNPEPLIAGSIGSYAAFLHDGSEYSGPAYAKEQSLDYIVAWHEARILTLLDAGVDFLAFHLMPSVKEVIALIEYLKSIPSAKAWFTFSCKTDGQSIVDGNNFKDSIINCYKTANHKQLIGLGLNCLPPKIMTPFIKSISQKEIGISIPLVAYPNSGEIYSKETSSWLPKSDDYGPEKFVGEWLDMGVRFIGGCCRTTDKDIHTFTQEVHKWKNNCSL
ncbi:homocysteine S-methyltransferase 1-like [Trichogramma pretiosum]|uniref:homocysteine S-methyltransferase 1-like n=1 Tax=Trichogramma pretiosum TaxID=7493 RepID=UPI0006C9827C|nr:homocysteine S-methyltransferase 1-like [Trichogramma pretiosum]